MAVEQQILFAGFGGQGVLAMGQFLAYAAMGIGKEVTWVPSYGAEMRGGTANCQVTISDEEISSPLTENPGSIVVMNRPSLDKFENKVKSNGTIVINSSLVDRVPEREDVTVYQIPANSIAEAMGNVRGANMIMLGAYLHMTGPVKVEEALEHFDAIFKGKKPAVIERNRQAFMTGVEWARNNQ
ncbi:MAG: 2-oxoacid:ferredoxin oxidoreductase subunit gamma [Syntrophomonadaceae bacterium]|nr:2-oxoacid:ferredoxin oxidoreductase subunit gamma [Syntrophomonadaceae bacterium]